VTYRRGVGVLLITVSLYGLVLAFLGLPVRFGAAGSLLAARSAPAFCLVAAASIVMGTVSSTRCGDRRGSRLGFASLGVLAAYFGVAYLLGGQAAAFIPVVALALSVLVTVLGWHLVMV